MKLNIGPGISWHKDGWKTLDYYNESDISLDLREVNEIPLLSSATNKVFCSHVIEHLSDDNVQTLFDEVYRIMAFGGVFRLSFPDAEKAINSYKRGDNSFFDEDEVLLLGESIEDRLINFFCSFKSHNYNGIDDYIGGPLGFQKQVKEKCELNIDEFISWTQSLMPEDTYYQGHINGWYFKKAETYLRNAGFEFVITSRYRESCDKELRLEGFDNRPSHSMFIEAIKLPKKFNCRTCNNTSRPSFVKMNEEFQLPIVKCNNCSFVQTLPVPEDYLTQYYINDFGKGRVSYSEEQLKFFDTRAKFQLEFILRSSQTSILESALDIGSGIGALARSLSTVADEVIAYDPDIKLRHYYDETAVQHITEREQLANFNHSFDLITCSHVLEHVIDIKGFCADLNLKLKENGLLFIEVPLEVVEYLKSSKCANDSGHFNHFSHDFLEDFLDNLDGFELLDSCMSGPSLRGYIDGEETLGNFLYNKEREEQGIHYRALLRKTKDVKTKSISVVDLTAFNELSYSNSIQLKEANKEISRLLTKDKVSEKKITEIGKQNQLLKTKIEDLQKKQSYLIERNNLYKNDQVKLKTNLETEKAKYAKLIGSSSWRITYPLRVIFGWLRRY
ncbi:methyltransferase domain-containing protein [Vibrio hangzhouensis]|uniref:methyltransferase domain-containing protein n=1 Tax=Vibrio hangzhouensis TaxID=462991 RepID=UPI001C97CB50|nr:methyltransferase domain-containing protein [Vibrio hangzhouensis]MBY6198492.1 class I SAM-dependent methyltransferase [Vibrio hangzhouensis]